MIMYIIIPTIFIAVSTIMYLFFASSLDLSVLILLLMLSAALGFHSCALIEKLLLLAKKEKSVSNVIHTNPKLIVTPILWFVCAILSSIGMAAYDSLFILSYVIMIIMAVWYLISIVVGRKKT